MQLEVYRFGARCAAPNARHMERGEKCRSFSPKKTTKKHIAQTGHASPSRTATVPNALNLISSLVARKKKKQPDTWLCINIVSLAY